MELKNKKLKIITLYIILLLVTIPSIIKADNNFEVSNIQPNQPPETPQIPDGPDEWVLDFEVFFETSTTDPDGNNVYYKFNWGDNSFSEWLGPFISGGKVVVSHIWTVIGDYEIRVIAKDVYSFQSNWSEPAIISIIENDPPEKATIVGPKVGVTKKYHDFSINSTDLNGHDIYYYISWGDGDYVNWDGPYLSGEIVTFSHTWSTSGNKAITVIVKDQFESRSPQSEFNFLAIKNRISNYNSLHDYLEKIIGRFFFFKNLFYL